MKIFSFTTLILVALIVGGFYLAIHGGLYLQNKWNTQLTDGTVVHVYVGSQPLFVEIANSPASITKGLSGRAQIGSDGMLFILPQPQIATFWMKDMLFDLDFVWLSQNQVVEITKNAEHPQPGLPDESLKIYSPHEPVDEVLEVPAGQFPTIKVGDQLEIK